MCLCVVVGRSRVAGVGGVASTMAVLVVAIVGCCVAAACQTAWLYGNNDCLLLLMWLWRCGVVWLWLCGAVCGCGCVLQALTPATAAARARTIRDKLGAATEADCAEVVAIAAAFPTEPRVQEEVCWAVGDVAYFGGASKVLAVQGHRTAVTALNAFPTDLGVQYKASYALYFLANKGGAAAVTAIRCIDGVIPALQRASGVLKADGKDDWAALALKELGV